jgi:hypothetical protein
MGKKEESVIARSIGDEAIFTGREIASLRSQ